MTGDNSVPLIQPVAFSLPENVETLLQAGANPNGMIFNGFESYALRFSCPVTEGERVKRWRGIQCFWTEHDLVSLDSEKNGDTAPALVGAARVGSIDIFDLLHNAGSDASFWFPKNNSMEPCVTQSLPAVSAPLHATIAGSYHDMLDHLLKLGLDSNHPNTYAFSKLIQDPCIVVQACTLFYGVHVLHFLVVRHMPTQVHNVTTYIPRHPADVTKLGHTLLHVACLPLDDKHIQIFSQKCYDSIHEGRSQTCS